MAYDADCIADLSLTTPTEGASYIPELNNSDREIKTILSYQYAVSTKTDNYTLLTSDSFIICNFSSAKTITLPVPNTVSSATYMKEYTIISIGSAAATITNSASENINGATTDWVLSTPYTGVRLWTNGTDWFAERFDYRQNIKGTDIASATTTDIGAAIGEYVDVTGTTTITGLGTVQAGTRRIVRFTGALVLTYNGTSLILPTSANITTVAGDVAMFVSLGSGNWRCVFYTRLDGSPVVATIASGTYTPTLYNSTNIDASTAFASQYMRVGNVVTVSGMVNVDPTATGSVNLKMSLPIASDFAAAQQCCGTIATANVDGEGGQIIADVSNNLAQCEWITGTTTNITYTYHFTYLIV